MSSNISFVKSFTKISWGVLVADVIALPFTRMPFGILLVAAFTTFCTAGVALIFWVPFYYIVGSIAFKIYRIVRGSQFEDEGLSSQDYAIRKYSLEAQKAGLSQKEIKSNLINAGWKEELVEQEVK